MGLHAAATEAQEKVTLQNYCLFSIVCAISGEEETHFLRFFLDGAQFVRIYIMTVL